MSDTRPLADIFDDLRTLCSEPGFLHAITFIKLRDFHVSVDHHGVVTPSREDRYSRASLNHNELMLLVGLYVQSDKLNVLEDDDTELLVSRADHLLEELHRHLEIPMRAVLHTSPATAAAVHHFGDLAKEFIYYGADSAFASQYQRFARDRYRPDFEWLLSEKGLSVRPMIEIAQYIEHIVYVQINHLLSHGSPAPQVLTGAFLVGKTLLQKRFRDRAERFLDCFSLQVNNSNAQFTNPFAYNEVTSRPLLDIGSDIYVADPYKLYDSIYESPYYWMLWDPAYCDSAAEHRGKFLEDTIARMMRRIFGNDRVFTNVVIRKTKAGIAAEADVLVVYGEFILVVQAKSKRPTLRARSGDTDKINEDFQASVQSAYDQAVMFIELLITGAECELTPRDRRSFKYLSRVFPVVILSDHFPSLTILVNHLVQKSKEWNPLVLDIFFLDVLGELLSHPVDMLYYLQQRARFFDKIITDSEFNILGFHMKGKLYVGKEVDVIMIDRDFAAEINEYFELDGCTAIKFLPLEERVNVPAVTALIGNLKAGPPEIAGTAIELLDFSEEALQGIAENIALVQAEVRAGKPFKAFSIETSYGGLSYVAVRILDERAKAIAEMIARKHKYNQKKDRWYVVLDHVYSQRGVDAISAILEEWKDSEDMRKSVEDIGPLLKETYIPFKRPAPVGEDPRPESWSA